MVNINTEIRDVFVEIDGVEYAVAPRTVETIDKLIAARRENVGKPDYKCWLSELEIVLGKDAVKELFKGGKKENIDRMQLIYVGVVKAFTHYQKELEDREKEEKAEKVENVIQPLNEMLKRLQHFEETQSNTTDGIAVDPERKIIRRG